MRFPMGMNVVAEETAARGIRYRIELQIAGDVVPALLLLPSVAFGGSGGGAEGAGRGPRARRAPRIAQRVEARVGAGVPGALLLHGYASRKELMAETVGEALLEQDVASLAIDLPLHGDRDAPVQAQAMRNPLQLLRQWRLALTESAAALRMLGDVPGVVRGQLGIVGYSMGAFVAVMVAAEEPAARAVVLAAGGDLPERTPMTHLVRRVADPVAAVRRFRGRPLLMVNGQQDLTVTAEQAERLFAAAGEPKSQRWYPGGHYLPPAAVADAARWLADALAGDESASREPAEGQEA